MPGWPPRLSSPPRFRKEATSGGECQRESCHRESFHPRGYTVLSTIAEIENSLLECNLFTLWTSTNSCSSLRGSRHRDREVTQLNKNVTKSQCDNISSPNCNVLLLLQTKLGICYVTTITDNKEKNLSNYYLTSPRTVYSGVARRRLPWGRAATHGFCILSVWKL